MVINVERMINLVKEEHSFIYALGMPNRRGEQKVWILSKPMERQLKQTIDEYGENGAIWMKYIGKKAVNWARVPIHTVDIKAEMRGHSTKVEPSKLSKFLPKRHRVMDMEEDKPVCKKLQIDIDNN